MKTLSAVVTAVSLGAAPLWAHEEGAAHADLILGQPPEYLHVLLHPVLIVGLALALVALAAGWAARSKPAQVIALALVLGCAATAWPVLGLGQNAYNRVRPQADETGQAWAREHMRRAETFVYVFYATALLAAAGLLAHRKWPQAVKPVTAAVLLAGASSLAVGGWISKAGGQIRHPEFRQSPPPTTVQSEHTHEHTKP
jgi:hypothetical protein